MILHMDDGSEVVIDEKSALYYPTPRKKINTFAFELKTEINAHLKIIKAGYLEKITKIQIII